MPRPPIAALVRTVAADADLLDQFRRGDAAAFEALARRHAGRVWAACRSVLGDSPDAEDAFQATFVVLARDPRAVRDGRAIGSWLYGVAHRIALKALARRARRAHVEARAEPLRAASAPDLSWREACVILHEELDRLPAKYRQPLMLCYLEGLPRDEAATCLGYSLNVLKGRLERGREALRQRLTKRGVTLSAGLLSALAVDARADAPSVFGLLETIARPSPAVAALAAVGHTPSIWVRVVVGLAASVLVAGLALGVPGGSQTEPPMKAKPAPVAKAEEKAERIAFAGTVVDPKGQPVAGAKVYLLRHREQFDTPSVDTTVKATSDAAGRFRFDIRAADYPVEVLPAGWWYRYTALVAAADGFGFGISPVTSAGNPDARIEMVEDVPIKGRLVTLEGKPVAGARVRVTDVGVPNDGLDKLFQKAEELGWNYVDSDPFRVFHRVGRLRNPCPFPLATTDKDGRFTLPGVGKHRVVTLDLEGPDITAAQLTVVNQPGPPGSFGFADAKNPPKFQFFRTPVDYVTAPVQPFDGRVTDRDTGRPIPNLLVFSQTGNAPNYASVRARTDRDGRYKLVGLDPGPHSIQVDPGPDDPYFVTSQMGGRTASLEPVRLDFILKRAARLTGRVTDVRTGLPVAGCELHYHPARDNEATTDYLGARRGLSFRAKTGLDGRFRINAVPGSGWLAVWGGSGGGFIPASERDLQGEVADRNPPAKLEVRHGEITPFVHRAIAAVTATLDKPTAVDVTVDSGVTVPVRLTGPDGEPVGGVRVMGADGSPAHWTKPLEAVEVGAFNPDRPRPIIFLHPDKNLGLLYQPKKGDAGWSSPTASRTRTPGSNSRSLTRFNRTPCGRPAIFRSARPRPMRTGGSRSPR